MTMLMQLAKASVAYVIQKEDDSEVGRTPTTAVNPGAGPAVPAEEVPAAPAMQSRSSKEIIRDAMSILREGMSQEQPQNQMQLSRTVNLLMKALRGEDIPVSVKALIKDRAGRTLVLRDAYSDFWDLPGGHVQEGEPLELALRREVKEETGMELGLCWQTDTRLLRLGEEDRPVMFYQVEYIGGQPRCSEEHLGYQWASDKELGVLNLGVFKDVLIPGPDDKSKLESGDPATYKEGAGAAGISGPGDSSVGSDSYTPAIGPGKRRLKALVPADAWISHLEKVSTGGGHLVTGSDTETDAPIPPDWEQRSMKLVKGLNPARYKRTGMLVLNKTVGKPFVVAGYASPVVIDREGHRINHQALETDVPRFMAFDGKYANVNIMHTNATVGHLLPEFTASDGTVYRTGVDDVGFYAVAEIRTDQYAPAICEQVIKDVETGYLKSFSISGNADNPVFMCDEQQCFYDISQVNLLEVTICEEGVNQGAKFSVVS